MKQSIPNFIIRNCPNLLAFLRANPHLVMGDPSQKISTDFLAGLFVTDGQCTTRIRVRAQGPSFVFEVSVSQKNNDNLLEKFKLWCDARNIATSLDESKSGDRAPKLKIQSATGANKLIKELFEVSENWGIKNPSKFPRLGSRVDYASLVNGPLAGPKKIDAMVLLAASDPLVAKEDPLDDPAEMIDLVKAQRKTSYNQPDVMSGKTHKTREELESQFNVLGKSKGASEERLKDYFNEVKLQTDLIQDSLQLKQGGLQNNQVKVGIYEGEGSATISLSPRLLGNQQILDLEPEIGLSMNADEWFVVESWAMGLGVTNYSVQKGVSKYQIKIRQHSEISKVLGFFSKNPPIGTKTCENLTALAVWQSLFKAPIQDKDTARKCSVEFIQWLYDISSRTKGQERSLPLTSAVRIPISGL